MRDFFSKIFKRTKETITSSKEELHAVDSNEERSVNHDTSFVFDKKREEASALIPKNKKNQSEEEFSGEPFEDLNNLFNESGKVITIPKDFPLKEALDQLINLLNDQDGIEAELIEKPAENLYIIQFKDLRTFRKVLKLAPIFHFYIHHENKELTSALGLSEWIGQNESNLPAPKRIGIFNQFYLVAITQYWEEIIWACVQQYYEIGSSDTEIVADTFILPSGRYVKDLKPQHIIWLLAQAPFPGDTLAWLPISELLSPKGNYSKSTEFYFLLTAQKTQILGFDQQGKCVASFYLSHKEVEVESGMGRSKFIQGKYEWYSFFKHNSIFEEVVKVIEEEDSQNRLQKIALQNWHHKASETSSNEFAIQLIQKRALYSQNIIDDLTVAFLSLASKNRDNALKLYADSSSLTNALESYVAEGNIAKTLPQWINIWKLSLQDTITILQLCLHIGKEKAELVKVLPFHRKIRDKLFVKRNPSYKDIDLLLFEIQFCEHLLMADQNEEAIAILEKIKENLPDETLADLLPPSNVNLSDNEAGPPVKVNVLELLTKAKGNENAKEEKLELARLQPLNRNRLKHILQINKDDDVVLKVKEIIRILAHDGMANYYSVSEERGFYNKIPTEEINNRLPHPATQNTGAFHQLKTWVAATKIPDYSHLKLYTERLGSQPNHQVYLDIIADIQVAFGINGVEAYLARGEKGVGIQAFEGQPNFIIIGSEHLNEKSVFFMNPLELRFAIGAEMAHLYFKHARITAQDVWQGAWQKGKVVLDTLIAGTSAIQAVTNVLGKAVRLGNILRQTEKISAVSATSADLVKWLYDTNNTYSGNNTKDTIQAEDQLLATSRLLQLTADRSGLLMCGSLHAAIRAILLTQRAFVAELPVAQRYGLTEVITRQNEDGEYVFQHLALRLASLIQFYISKDYQVLEELLFEKEQ